jgi:hypothetical protein
MIYLATIIQEAIEINDSSNEKYVYSTISA